MTEQKRQMTPPSEDRYRLLVESVSDYAIFILDPDGHVMTWNRGAERFKGYTADEIIGRSYRTFYTNEDREARLPEALLAKARDTGHVEIEGWRVRKDGTRFWASVVITTILDEDGEFVGDSKVTRDLTERKAMADLAARTAQLQASNRLKTEFMATMSHELRTPLNSIIGFTELVLMTQAGRIDETAANNLHTVLRNARHLLTLISEILDLSKIEAGQSAVHASPGLGLAISRKLAELLDGALTLESTVGEGSTFIVTLPRQLKGRGAGSHEGTPRPATPSARVDGEPLVLAIDDDPEALQLIVENLKGSRFQVVTATSAESGLHLVRELRPDVITLDVLMPHIDGWMALRRLKSQPATADIPVVLLSFLENKGLATRLGAHAYLNKPIDGRALLEVLDRACGASVGKVS